MSFPSFTLAVDWAHSGTATAEGGNIQSIKVKRGRKNLVKPGGKGFEQAKVGECIVTLANNDGRYDPLGTASALYPNVKPGCDAYLQCVYDGGTYDVFRGRVAALSPVGSQTNKRMRMTVHDGWDWLDSKGSRRAVAANTRTDTAIGHLLNDASYPAAWGSALGTSSDTLDYWWSETDNVADDIRELVESEYGYCHVAANGALTFQSRASGYNPTSEATLTEASIAEIDYAMPWEAIRNVVSVTAYPRTLQARSVLWTLRDVPRIDSVTALKYIAEFAYNNEKCPATNLVEPVTTTDFTANSLADGTGTDLTSEAVITLNYTYGQSCELQASTNVGEAFLTLLQIRGKALTAGDATVIQSDNSSGSNYGKRRLSIDLRWQQSVERAKDLADWLASLFSDPHAFPVLRLTPDNHAVNLARDLNDIITLNLTTLGINDKFRIGYIELDWDAARPEIIDMIWSLEPVDSTRYWILGTSTLGTSTRLAY